MAEIQRFLGAGISFFRCRFLHESIGCLMTLLHGGGGGGVWVGGLVLVLGGGVCVCVTVCMYMCV